MNTIFIQHNCAQQANCAVLSFMDLHFSKNMLVMHWHCYVAGQHSIKSNVKFTKNAIISYHSTDANAQYKMAKNSPLAMYLCAMCNAININY